MKNLLIFIISIGFFITSYSQITHAEYFIDNDPGVGNATPIVVNTPGMTIDESFTLPTAALTNGLHVLHIRTKGTNNVWSLYKRSYFFIHAPNNTLVATNVVAAEYFVDADPGVGSATNIPITAGMTIDESFTVPTAALTNGLHVLHIRVKDADDTWSLYHRSYFYIHAPNNNLVPTNLVAAEYFIDADPGVGSATNIPVTAGMAIDHTFTLPTAALTDGLHVLHIRVKDADNTWSLYHRSYFFIHAPNSNVSPANLVEAEYFIDNDPGVGSANSLAITNGLLVDEVFSIPTGALTNGLHVLHIRVRDESAADVWSLYHRAYFFIHESNSNLTPTPIVDAEYFIDTDPGVGSGIPIAVTNSMNAVEIFSVPIPLAFADGDHYLHVRVQDQDGTWSLYKRKLFVVDATVSDNTCSGVTRTWSAGVWDDGFGDNSLPNVDDIAIIDADYHTNTDGNIDACMCTINAGNKVTIYADEFVSLTNNLVNDGEIEVKNNGSFTQFHAAATVTGNGTFKVERTTNDYLENDYTYWSSPTESDVIGTVFAANNPANIYDFTTANFEDLFDGNYPQNTGMPDTFDDNNNDWQVVTSTSTMTPGKGYIVQGFGTNIINTETKNFTDTFNTGDITIPVSLDANQTDLADNDNLIGNPYPSSIDAISFMLKNPILSGTIYFWTHNTQMSGVNPGPDAQNFTNNDYATWVAAGGVQANTGGQKPTDFIASCQGFFASVNANGNVLFQNNMRLKSNNGDFFRPTNNSDDNQRPTTPVSLDGHQIWLNMTNDSDLFRQILIGFYDDATNDHDRLFDGKRLFSGNNFDFSSLSGNTHYAIQGYAQYTDERIVPLSMKVTQTGILHITIDEMDAFFDTENVYLRDNDLQILHDLKISNYSFNAATIGEFNDRFELLFRSSPLSTNNHTIQANEKLIASNQSETTIGIKTENKSIVKELNVYDLLGKLILNDKPNSNNFRINTTIKTGTVLIIKARLENGNVLHTKFVKL
ncbi:MAG: hypothetical protein V3U80_08365 [Flavobacteriaceae bacterium]